MLMVAALFAFQILVALYMQKVLGYGAAETGLAMLPAALAIGAVSLGRLRPAQRPLRRARASCWPAWRCWSGLLGLLTRVPVHADYVTDLLPVMLLAAGFGLALPALTTLGMSGAEADDAGLASGLFNTTQQIGMALGVAVLSTLAASRTEAAARCRASRGGGADRRLPPGLRRRRRAAGGRLHRRAHRAAPAPSRHRRPGHAPARARLPEHHPTRPTTQCRQGVFA